ncbi:hypothetical protein BpHYR1_002118 [Brachionus plicatilis]|uniref:Uncharacterized protein n=1 Tax=Brachionus plicatilis TaxID=10195 RepID=A0A3M7PJM7_BRAPC|nr:hypothetical protein BpHYR1_002118 [Brachionus plicatilis]
MSGRLSFSLHVFTFKISAFLLPAKLSFSGLKLSPIETKGRLSITQDSGCQLNHRTFLAAPFQRHADSIIFSFPELPNF